MAERRTGRRLRRVALWLLTAALAGYALLDDDGRAPSRADEDTSPKDTGRLRIAEIDPFEMNPGDAVRVRTTGARDPAQVQVLVTKPRSKDWRRKPLEVLHRKGTRIIVQIPASFPLGMAKMRVSEGERESSAIEFRVEPVQRRKQVRNVIGGLALFILGLRMLSRGLRSWAGHHVRGFLGKVTRGSPRAVGLGALVGAVTQLTTTASGLVVGLLEPGLIALGAAIGVLIGAQLGAAATVAVLPLASAREGLLVLAIGVAWISFAGDRRSTALGNVILGAGLLLFGLHLLRIGFEPMVADPHVLPYLGYLRAASIGGYLACAASGILMAALLQGPAPVFVLVLGIAQSTGAIDLPHALAILSGTAAGAGIATTAVAWPFGRNARRLALAHLLLGGLVTVVVLVGLPLWVWLADLLVSGDPEKVAYGKKVLLPSMDVHLATGFVASQIVAAALATAVLSGAVRVVRRAIPPRQQQRSPALQVWSGSAGAEGAAMLARKGLVRALDFQRAALESALALCRTGDRTHGTASEHALVDARAEVEDLLPNLVGPAERGAELEALRRAALSILQLQRAVEDLLRLAERSVERNLLLVESDDEPHPVRKGHNLVIEGLDVLRRTIETAEPPDLEMARDREIRLNAQESSGRTDLLAPVEMDPDEVPGRMRMTELLDAYENVGNHVYRVFEALGSVFEDTVS